MAGTGNLDVEQAEATVPAPRPRRSPTLTPLEGELIGEIRANRVETREDFGRVVTGLEALGTSQTAGIDSLRKALGDARSGPWWLPWMLGAFFLTNVFLIGLLAEAAGIDPQRASSAATHLISSPAGATTATTTTVVAPAEAEGALPTTTTTTVVAPAPAVPLDSDPAGGGTPTPKPPL